MKYFLALLLLWSGVYLFYRVVYALFTGELRFKPKRHPFRVIHFRESPREFLVIMTIFVVVGIIVLYVAWTVLHSAI